MNFQKEVKTYIENNYDEMLQILRELCYIPAPSHHEEARAEYCKNWLEINGAEGVYIDEALNVIFPYHCENSTQITVLAAHTDTVFPDTEPMPYYEDEEKIYCPGVGDDTASVAVLLMTARFFIRNHISAQNGILFVCNSCEEGLGNLKGTRQLMKDYEGRIAQFITMDSHLDVMHTKCVGSCRYRVEARTEGGHSFAKFGNINAITVLSKMICEIYSLEVPQIGDSKTTYNVGNIEGGTSVNTIAQKAQMLCEYRSDNKACMDIMEEQFNKIFRHAEGEGIEIIVERIGERPCGTDEALERAGGLVDACKEIIEEVLQKPVICNSASTDCNIPMSMGIPSVCIGVFQGEGSHTREEWVAKTPLKQGLEIAIEVLCRITERV